jgi:hypothetical protein
MSVSRGEPNSNSSKQGLSLESELQRLRRNIYRSDIEKLSIFTKMLRRNALLSKAKVTHK